MAYTAAQLTSYYTLVNQGVAPDSATSLLLSAYAQEDSNGPLTDAQTRRILRDNVVELYKLPVAA